MIPKHCYRMYAMYVSLLPAFSHTGISKPPCDWPRHGVIRFEDVSVGYAKHLDPVLQCINLHFHSKEKVSVI